MVVMVPRGTGLPGVQRHTHRRRPLRLDADDADALPPRGDGLRDPADEPARHPPP